MAGKRKASKNDENDENSGKLDLRIATCTCFDSFNLFSVPSKRNRVTTRSMTQQPAKRKLQDITNSQDAGSTSGNPVKKPRSGEFVLEVSFIV